MRQNNVKLRKTCFIRKQKNMKLSKNLLKLENGKDETYMLMKLLKIFISISKTMLIKNLTETLARKWIIAFIQKEVEVNCEQLNCHMMR